MGIPAIFFGRQDGRMRRVAENLEAEAPIFLRVRVGILFF